MDVFFRILIWMAFIIGPIFLELVPLLLIFTWLLVFNLSYSKNIFTESLSRRAMQKWFVALAILFTVIQLIVLDDGGKFLMLLLEKSPFPPPPKAMIRISKTLLLSGAIMMQCTVILLLSGLLFLANYFKSDRLNTVIYYFNWVVIGPALAFLVSTFIWTMKIKCCT